MGNTHKLRVKCLEGLNMTIAQLITLALVFGAFALGRYSGYHDGYVKGRKAVRKYYESIQVGR